MKTHGIFCTTTPQGRADVSWEAYIADLPAEDDTHEMTIVGVYPLAIGGLINTAHTLTMPQRQKLEDQAWARCTDLIERRAA